MPANGWQFNPPKESGNVFAAANKEVVAPTAEGEKRERSPYVITVIC